MAAVTVYGDITPRTAAYAVKQLLTRGMPYMYFEKFGQTYPIPNNSTRVAKFRRYFLSGSTGAANDGNPANAWSIPLSTTPLVEGVTPTGRKLANYDYTVTLNQYGDYMTITDVIMDTHEDQILQQATEVLGESAALTIETIRYNVLKAGTNVLRAGGVGARNLVALPIGGSTTPASVTNGLGRAASTLLNRQNAKKITSVVASTPDFNTKSVEAAYIAVTHPDLESDIRNLPGFKPVADYGPHTAPFEGEIGSVEQIRYLCTTVCTPFYGEGAAVGVTGLRATGGNIDVYPVLIFGRDAYGIVPLKGKDSITPMVVNPKPVAGDPLAQRGTVGWKAWQNAIILNDAWMVRLEVGATA